MKRSRLESPGPELWVNFLFIGSEKSYSFHQTFNTSLMIMRFVSNFFVCKGTRSFVHKGINLQVGVETENCSLLSKDGYDEMIR